MNGSGPRLPDTFVVGAAKCGTTTICAFLDAHPEVWFSRPMKEPHWFSDDLDLARTKHLHRFEDYVALFAGATPQHAAVAEGSPSYLVSEVAARRIADHDPAARIVITLRDPVTMIDSLHSQLRLAGLQPLHDPREALTYAIERDGEPLRGLGVEVWRRYLDVARFGAQVQRYLDVFPREQVHVVLLDDLAADATSFWGDLEDFLGLPHVEQARPGRVNPNQVARSYRVQRLVHGRSPATKARLRRLLPAGLVAGARRAVFRVNVREAARPPLDPTLAAEVRTRLQPDVERLETLLHRDLRAWKTGGS